MRRFHVLKLVLLGALLAGTATVAGSTWAAAADDGTDLRVVVSPDQLTVADVTPLRVDISLASGTTPLDVVLTVDVSGLHGVEVLAGSTGCLRNTTRFVCTWPGSTLSGAHGRQLVFPLRRVAGTPAGAAGNVSATVRSARPDPVSENNTDSASVTVATTSAQLAATVADPAAAVPGTDTTVQWSVVNAGPTGAVDVTAIFSAPDRAAFFQPPAGCSRSFDNRTLTCPLGDLPAGGAAPAVPPIAVTVFADARPDASAGRVTLIVTGTPAPGYPAPPARDANYAQSALATLGRVADLHINASPTSGQVGETVSVVVIAANSGPSQTPYTYDFTVPSGTELVSAPAICRPTTGAAYRCTPTQPAASGGPMFVETLLLRITGPTVGGGQVTIAGSATDPNPATNTSPIEITVTA